MPAARTLLAPDASVGVAALLFVLGLAVVGGVVVATRHHGGHLSPDPTPGGRAGPGPGLGS